jgi:phospholipase/carboxylesterase
MREKVGKLDCLKRPGEDEGRNIVLLHGFGANADDLFPLADFLDPEEQWNFYVPNAPNRVDIGGGFTGLGWFPISIRELESGVDFTKVRPPGMDQSRDLVSDMLFHLNSKELYLGGFSQGAMIATEVALEQPENLKGLILYSGTLLDESGWTKRMSALHGMRFLQSHGMQDQVLPFAYAQKLNDMLKKAGAVGDFMGFGGGHEIPLPVLKKTQEFIRGK